MVVVVCGCGGGCSHIWGSGILYIIIYIYI